MVAEDRPSKYAQFISLSHPYTATTVAKLFIDNVFKLHCMPLYLLSVTGTQPSLVFFGGSFLNYKVLNYATGRPTILNLMVNLRLSIDALKLT